MWMVAVIFECSVLVLIKNSRPLIEESKKLLKEAWFLDLILEPTLYTDKFFEVQLT